VVTRRLRMTRKMAKRRCLLSSKIPDSIIESLIYVLLPIRPS
jgi:hypothetical protein